MTLSVVIPTLNAADGLPATLESLKPDDGLVREVIVSDGGSTDDTAAIAETAGARVITGTRGRGQQLTAGAAAASGDWRLFLHADTVLEAGWADAVQDFIADPANRERAAVFAFALDDTGPPARRIERLARWRGRWLALPYGDQGLLIHRDFYARLGGFRPIALMEDVDLVRRIGRRRLAWLDARATTSAVRYRRGGFWRRPLRHLFCLSLYFLGLPPRLIARIYR